MSTTIIPLANGYMEYRFCQRFRDWRDTWQYVRTVTYDLIVWG